MEAVLFSNLDSFKSVPIYLFWTLYLYLVVHLQIHSPYLTVSVLQQIAAPNQVTLNAQDFLLLKVLRTHTCDDVMVVGLLVAEPLGNICQLEGRFFPDSLDNLLGFNFFLLVFCKLDIRCIQDLPLL